MNIQTASQISCFKMFLFNLYFLDALIVVIILIEDEVANSNIFCIIYELFDSFGDELMDQ